MPALAGSVPKELVEWSLENGAAQVKLGLCLLYFCCANEYLVVPLLTFCLHIWNLKASKRTLGLGGAGTFNLTMERHASCCSRHEARRCWEVTIKAKRTEEASDFPPWRLLSVQSHKVRYLPSLRIVNVASCLLASFNAFTQDNHPSSFSLTPRSSGLLMTHLPAARNSTNSWRAPPSSTSNATTVSFPSLNTMQILLHPNQALTCPPAKRRPGLDTLPAAQPDSLGTSCSQASPLTITHSLSPRRASTATPEKPSLSSDRPS